MADIESNVKVNIDTSDALTQLKLLQQQISAFQQAMRKAGADNALAARQMQQNLANSINATGKFQANIQTIQTTSERFTSALEKNKLTMGEYFRYAGGASKSFGKLFKSEFETINQVARERVKDLQTQYIKLGRDANGAMKAIAVRPLALDMENLGTKTQIAAQRQQLFNQLMKQGSTNLLNFGKNTQWAGRQLMVGFTVPLVMMGSAAAKAYTEIEKASIAFRRVYGDINTTANETEKMVSSVRALATEFTKYGVAVADTMDMAAKAAAMGKTGADLLAQVQQANKLSVLGQVDQQQALDTTISLTNAFGVATDELAGKIDFLNAVENQTVTSIEDLTIAIPKAAPVIQQLGGDVEDLTFFLTAMREGGINASEGANALKSGLASMINPTGKANEFLQSFGINLKGIVEANKGDVKGTVINFAKALDTLDPLNRARAIEQLFGKFQFSRISTLFKNVIDEGSQANKVAGLARDTAEELAILSERELKKVSDSPLYKFQKSVEEMKSKLAPVGEAFLKAVTPVVEFVGKILDGFNNLSDGAKQFASIATLAIAGIGPILLMTFGLIANGVANIMKMFVNLKSFFNKTGNRTDILGEQTSYMNTEQLRGAAIAASLDQAHAKLRQTFTSEAAAVDALTQAYKRAVTAQGAYAGVPGVPVGGAGAQRRKYANGVSMVPGPAGAGDIVPALLSPGEAVIPAKHARKYAPVIAGMVAGNLPGFENGTTGVGMRQSIIGPLTQKQTDGMARTALQLDEISKDVMAGPYGKVAPNNYGVQVSPSPGHSFPAFGVGGIYQKPDGTKVFVKPQMSLQTALAEMRGTEIARSAHGLEAPKQKIGVMMDPTDPADQRRFIVLESPVDEKFSNIPTEFTKNQYFKQLVASLLRGDKDLGLGNLGGSILADVGPAGVFQRASGKRELGGKVNSMEEQAIINLLGVKGGAKRFFAESTSDIARNMTPAQYDAAIKAEIQAVMPKLQATIAGFGKLNPAEKAAYMDMQRRLQAGMGVDWSKYQVMHSKVEPKKYSKGTPAATLESPKNPLNFQQALASMSNTQMRTNLRIQDTHLVTALDIKDPKYLAQVKRVYPDATPQQLDAFEPVANLTAQLPGNMNQVMKFEGGYDGQFFGKIWNGLRHKLSKTAKIAGISLEDSQAVEDELGQSLSRLSTVNDVSVSNELGKVLGEGAKVTDLSYVKKKIWEQAFMVGGLRSNPKNMKTPDVGSLGTGKVKYNDIFLKALQDGALTWNKNKTGLVMPVGADGIRAATWNMWYFGHGEKKDKETGESLTSIEDLELRRRAQEKAQAWANAGNYYAPMPTSARSLKLPPNWNTMSKAKQMQLVKTLPALKEARLVFEQQDAEVGKFNDKKTGFLAYDAQPLKSSPLSWTPGKELETYNLMSQRGPTGKSIIPDNAYSYFNKLALKMNKGGMIPGYNKGVFSVPGPKGAGDVVPAMLTPGEAVIPADRAEQHRGLITQMIAGKLPGYNKGTPGVPGYNKGIPGVPTPPPYVPPTNSGGFLQKAKSVADSVARNGLGAVAKGLEVGKNALIKAGDKALTEMLASDFKKADAEEKLRIERLNRTRLHLEANNEEYAQLKRESELYQEQKMISSPTKSEQAQQSARTRAMRAMEAQMEADFQASGKDQTKQGRFKKLFQRNENGNSMVGAAFGLSSAVGMLTQVPGQIGQSAQAMIGPIGAATAAMSLIPGPAGIAVGALAGLGLGAIQLNENFAKIRNDALALGTAMGSSTKAIDKFADFAKTVTGSQAMDKRRETSAGTFFNVVQGKTTFGESYVKSDAGKELVKSVGDSIKGGGLDQAKSLIVNQLSTAIASGALNPAQARSIASNLGAQLGDMSLGIEVAGRITDLVGPNGEDLKKEPLEVRMKLVSDSVDQLKKQADIANASATKVENGISVAGNTAAGSGIGAGTGLAIAGIAAGVMNLAPATTGIIAATAALGSTVPIVGTIVGALVGAGIAVVQIQADIAKNAGYLQASLGSALSVQQQMVDSLTIDYDKRIATATAAGDIAEATRLQNQYLADQAELLQFNKEKTEEMYGILNNQATGFFGIGDAQTANLDAAKESLIKAFEGTGQEVQAKLAKEQIESMAGSTAQKTMLMSAVAQKQIGLNQVGVAKTAFGNDQAGADTLQKLMENSPTELNRTLGLAGNMGAEEQKKFVVDMSLKDPIEAKIMNDAVELAQKTTGVFFGEKKTAEAIMKFAVENPEKMLEFQENIAELKNVSGATFDITVAQKILGPNLAKALGEKSVGDFFKKYNKQNKIVFLSQFQQTMTMLQEGDKDMIASYNAWNASNGMKKTYADYAAWQSDRTVTTQGVDNTGVVDPNANKGGGGGPQASFLDPYVESLRNASNFQQKLTIGFAASLKALRGQEGALTKFAGLAMRLKSSGADTNFIEAVLGGDQADIDKIINRATGKLTKAGEDAIRIAKKVENAKIGMAYVLADESGRLEKDNQLYNAGLEVIAAKEKKINEKYDARLKALDEISKIQEKNNQQQQDSMSLADALSKGDIAAAARAAMQAKQNEQKAALDDAKSSIENARKNELEAITVRILGQTVRRDELEARIAANSEKIAIAKKDELDRQIQIGKNAVITANASARTLANGQKIAGLNATIGGGTPVLGGDPTPKPKPKPIPKNAILEADPRNSPAPSNAGKTAADPVTTGILDGMSIPKTVRTFTVGNYIKLPAGVYLQGIVDNGTTAEITMSSILGPGLNIKATGKVGKLERGFDGKLTPLQKFAKGGMVYASNGLHVEASKYALGTDTIPAMLTPGEFVMRKSAVDSIGADKLSAMNTGTSTGESVYNYSITVNANSSDASGIADAVLREIERLDSRRIRSSNI